MGTVTITPSAAQEYQGSSAVSYGTYSIGWNNSASTAFGMRYSFKSTKRLKKITVKINGTLAGTRDGKFVYSLSTSPSYPSSWKSVAEEGNGYLSITHEGKLAANTTYYLFVTKETGNFVVYSGCGADKVTITGETANAVRVYSGGEWKEATPYVYSGGTWKEATPCVYSGGEWKETS